MKVAMRALVRRYGSQKEAARASGLKGSLISNVLDENLTRVPGLENLLRLRAALGWSVDSILGLPTIPHEKKILEMLLAELRSVPGPASGGERMLTETVEAALRKLELLAQPYGSANDQATLAQLRHVTAPQLPPAHAKPAPASQPRGRRSGSRRKP